LGEQLLSDGKNWRVLSSDMLMINRSAIVQRNAFQAFHSTIVQPISNDTMQKINKLKIFNKQFVYSGIGA